MDKVYTDMYRTGHFTIRQYQGRDEKKKGLWRLYRNSSDGWKNLTKDWVSHDEAARLLDEWARVKYWKFAYWTKDE